MAAFFIVSIQLDNPAARPLYDAYIKKVRPIVERHGGRYLVRTERLAHLAGDWRPDRVIMIRFPDRAALEACFASKNIGPSRICGLRLSGAARSLPKTTEPHAYSLFSRRAPCLSQLGTARPRSGLPSSRFPEGASKQAKATALRLFPHLLRKNIFQTMRLQYPSVPTL